MIFTFIQIYFLGVLIMTTNFQLYIYSNQNSSLPFQAHNWYHHNMYTNNTYKDQ